MPPSYRNPVPEVTIPGVPVLTPRRSISTWCEYGLKSGTRSRGQSPSHGSFGREGKRPANTRSTKARLASASRPASTSFGRPLVQHLVEPYVRRFIPGNRLNERCRAECPPAGAAVVGVPPRRSRHRSEMRLVEVTDIECSDPLERADGVLHQVFSSLNQATGITLANRSVIRRPKG